MSALSKVPGKIGFGNIRLNQSSTPNLNKLKENLEKVLLQQRQQSSPNISASNGKVAAQIIDTANIFDNGDSERAVGEVITKLNINEDLKYFYISKFGYFHSEKQTNEANDMTTLTPASSQIVEHSGDADFMRKELSQSLKNLNKTSLDAYLIHEPEEQLRKEFPFIIDDAASLNSDNQQQQPNIIPPSCTPSQRDEFLYEYYKPCIAALEEEIHLSRRIHSYGISTNTIGLPPSHPHHINPELFLNMSKDVLKSHAAIPSKNTNSGFQIIQTPFNICETSSLSIINNMLLLNSSGNNINNELYIMALRPLTVVDDRSIWNLEGLVDHAVYSSGKWSSINEIQELNDTYEATVGYFTPPEPLDPSNPTQDEQDTIEACGLLKSLLNDLLTEFPKFISVEMYENNLQQSIIPMIHKTFDGMDDDSIDQIQGFFDKYGKAVRSMAPYHMQSYVDSTIDPFTGDNKNSTSCISETEEDDEDDDEGSYDVQTTHQIPPDTKIEQYSLQWLLHKRSPIDTILLDEINL
jgi:hypothetical protein